MYDEEEITEDGFALSDDSMDEDDLFDSLDGDEDDDLESTDEDDDDYTDDIEKYS